VIENRPESDKIRTTQHAREIGLYFHIPFCTKKCPYCHFYVIPNKNEFHKILETGLSLEWERQLPHLYGKEIVSIYFGGGTPSLFAPYGIKTILDKIRESKLLLSTTCEITIEANPEEGSFELFESLIKLGINRLSLGVQSLDDRSLQTLERIHTAQKAKSSIHAAEKAGFKNISIDLMYDLPNQTESSWLYSLDQLPDLPIQHLSLYNLTIEPHTSFYKKRHTLSFATQDTSLRFLETAVEKIEKIGLLRYEISAFAKPGRQSRHNLGYWTGRPFLGFGPSAFSLWEGERFRNIANLQRYTRSLINKESPIDLREKLPYPQNIKELIAVGLRLLDGIEISPSFPQEIHCSINRLIEQNLLLINGSKVQLSKKGLLFHDTVASELI
jgi:oxygen-independent coproporphyrinogen-3 oxidase